MQLERGADYRWPECYFDLRQRKLVLAPEYGGDATAVKDLAAQGLGASEIGRKLEISRASVYRALKA